MTLTEFVESARNGALSVWLRGAAAILLALTLLPCVAPAQNANDGFDPDADEVVATLAVQLDGKILLGGAFTTLNGGAVTRNRIARLNADGSVDPAFNPNANDQVVELAVQPDGRVLLAGGFTTLNGGAVARNYIARLNVDGSVDPAFNPNANGSVLALAVQPDGRVLLGGFFTTLNGGAVTRNSIARLNADGSVDLTFNPNANGYVYALAVQSDHKILIGGDFTTLNGGAVTRNYIARLNADGSVDAAFDPNANGGASALAVQPDGKILVGGGFTTLNGGVVTRNYIARLNADGSVDATFDPNANGGAGALAVQPDGKILLGGGFTTLNGGAVTRNSIARLNPDGSVDASFDPNAHGAQSSVVGALAVQPDGGILLGGWFTTLNGGAVTRNHIARLNADGCVDGTFAPNANGPVDALAEQPDGGILLAGEFTTSNNGGTVIRNEVSQINSDGSVVTTFDPNANDLVYAVAVQPNGGKIIIGGDFTTLNGGAVTRNYIARLNADGTVDDSFDPNANGPVYAVAVQATGKILIGGDFTTLKGGAYVRNHVARLLTDGSVDLSFIPSANDVVTAIAVQSDDGILLGGYFTLLKGLVTRNHIARLDRVADDGSVDLTFNPNADDAVVALAVQPSDGKILLGGYFTALHGGAVARNHIARLSANGDPDTHFNPDANDAVMALAVQPDGKIVVGGDFITLNGGTVTRNYIARLNADQNGSVDLDFDPNANNETLALAVQPDGKVLLGGYFTTLNGGAVTRHHMARLNANGSVDSAFDPNASGSQNALAGSGSVNALAVLTGGQIVLGGNFTSVNVGQVPRHYVARYKGDGHIDTTFDPNVNNGVTAFAVQPDAKIVLGGMFTTLNGGAATRNSIARINADGSVDPIFNPNANNSVDALALQPDGKIVLGGYFTALNGGSIIRNSIARLNGDGSVDGFNPNANGAVATVALQADNKVVLGGYFTSVHSTTRNYLARTNADGSLDGNFNPNADSSVLTLAVQPDGGIVLGGNFASLKGGAAVRHRIARVDSDGNVDPLFDPDANGIVYGVAVQADGKILICGGFDHLKGNTIARNHIARLNADGSVDLTYDPNVDSEVDALAIETDGKVLLGGIFTQVNGTVARNNIARLSSSRAALQSLDVNGSTVTWLRSGAGPELELPPTLEMSMDGVTYAPLGTLARVPGGWGANGILTQPVGQTFYLRTRGMVSSGMANGSQGLIESVRQFYHPDRIFAGGFE